MFGASPTGMHCQLAAISMPPSAQQKIPDTLGIRNFRLFSSPSAKANAPVLQPGSSGVLIGRGKEPEEPNDGGNGHARCPHASLRATFLQEGRTYGRRAASDGRNSQRSSDRTWRADHSARRSINFRAHPRKRPILRLRTTNTTALCGS